MPNKLIRYLGELPEASWDPAMFSHRRLTPIGRRRLNRDELLVTDDSEGDFPDASNVDRAAHELFVRGIPSWRHARATNGGVMVGKWSIHAHNDSTPGWTLFTLVWMRDADHATLQVGTEWWKLEPGEVVAFKANTLHSWVCNSPWTAVFTDLEREILA